MNIVVANPSSRNYTKDDFLKEIALCDLILTHYPNDINILRDKGINLCDLDRFDEGIECFNKIIKLKPDDIEAITYKGSALSDSKRYEEAIKCFDISLTINPNQAFIHNSKGIDQNEKVQASYSVFRKSDFVGSKF